MSPENVEVVREFVESMVPSIQDQSSNGEGDFEDTVPQFEAAGMATTISRV
jgi:hypothetical protein